MSRQPKRHGRMIASVLLTDIVGSTGRAEELGDREWSRLLAEHTQVVRRELARYGSVLFKETGEGYLGVFPMDVSGPEKAVVAGFGIVDSLAALGLRVRVGIDGGTCTLSSNGARGAAVRMAARIMRVARPGEVLVSSSVRDLLERSETTFEDRGLHQFRGVLRRQHLFAAVRGTGRPEPLQAWRP